jgi:ElaB/YqjD/DUF883 family membrane-anchored ribosome-binding protein
MEQPSSGAKSNNGDFGRGAIAHEAEEQLEHLRERIGELNEHVIGFIKERPGTSLLVAAAVGFLIGRILRS